MTNDVIPTSEPSAAETNGQPTAETLIERATRILRGDIHPDDYLRLPPDAAAKVEWEFEMAQKLRPGGVLTETEKHRIRQDRVVEYHYGGRWVVTLRTPAGVIALASGEDIGIFSRTIPAESRHGIRCEYSHPWE